MEYAEIQDVLEEQIKSHFFYQRVPASLQDDLAQEARLWFLTNLDNYDPEKGSPEAWISTNVRAFCLSAVSRLNPRLPKKCRPCALHGNDFCEHYGTKSQCPYYRRAITKWSIKELSIPLDLLDENDVQMASVLPSSLNLDSFDVEGFIKTLKERLTKKQSVIFHLIFEEGLSPHQISQRMHYHTSSTKGNWTARWHLRNIKSIAQALLDEME